MTDKDRFSIVRSAAIDAPPETVFGFIDDFHEWVLWSPWEKVDVELQKIYGGPEAGKGATYEWVGKKTGHGRMEILSSTPAALVEIDLQFFKPFKQRNRTTFALAPEAGGTRVTWTMTGAHNLMSKVMGLLINMDKMVGKDFATGLANLKAISEAKRAAA